MGLGKVTFTALVLSYFGTVRSQTPTLYQNTLTCPSGWTYLGGDKCYKVYQGNYERTWHRAKNICERYGSHLVNFKDQEEANKVGDLVNTDPLNPKSFWIGVFCPEKLCATGAFNTRGEAVTPNQATAWVDGQPNWKTGQCVYTKKNHVKYVFEKPYAQSMDHCSVKRSFVCERMAAPPDSFHCFSGGYVHGNNLCNGRHDCQDGSDEMDCPGNCNYYYNVASGQISLPSQFTRNYDNSQTCTWAIKTPLGSNVYINFTTFNTEEDEDTVQVYVKSVVEVNAMHVTTLSGQQKRDVAIRSSNNMMYIKFSSDGSVTRPGFQATFDSVTTNLAYEVMELTATSAPATYSTPVHVVGGVGAFVAMTDYVYLISANDPYQIVTVEILNLKLGDDDKIVFYDGESPHSMELLTVCSNCEDYTVISSTGRYLSIHLSTDKPVESAFTFRYKQGCDVTLTNDYGMLFSPGYVGNIKYPNNIVCTWTVNVDEPISIYFDSDLDFEDDFTCLDRSNDYLKVFEGLNENGTPLHSGDGFMATQLRGTTHQSASGKFFLQFMSSPTMNSRGFMARWSKDCVSPMYDEYTIINSGAITVAPYHYTSTMTLTCDTGYGFHQQQIPAGQIAVTLTCNYKGEWNWKKIPRCTPNYCGVAPDIMNGYIAYSTKSVYEGVASYECYPGSSLVSIVGPGNNNNITCQANGEWQTPPFCQTATCNLNLVNQRPPNGEGTIRTGTGDGTTIGSIIDFSCADGFEIDGDPILICMDNGQWSSNNPTCKRKTCLLPSIPNGQVISVSSFIDFGSIVSVQCDTGYEFEDPAVNSMECLADRTLDQIPVCVDIDECDASPCQTYCHNNIGSFTCSCDPGYELVGQTVCNDKDECSSGEHKCDGFCTNTPPGSYTCSCSLPEVLFTSNGLHGYFVPSSETGYLPTDTLRIDQSCVLISCDDPQDPQNGRYFPKRTKHRYGDVIEYQCNLGYGPRSSTRTCLQNGQWSAPPSDCLPEQCPNDVFTNPANEASFQIGPYDYLEDLYLNCTVATKNFLKRRKCVYNPAIDRYEMQGSSYECGELDCGTPYQAPGSNYFAFDTTYGASFEFGCSAGNNPTGSSSETVIDNTVTCGADGYWNFGNLQCFSQSCNDPGYPAGGEMIASSFADRSIVTFRCTKSGYTLTHTDSIVCLGTIFNGTAPRCVDTTPPSIGLANGQPCDGTYTITVKKYSSIPLPTVLYSDNDGIATFTVEPANANTTLKVENDLTVVFRATDYSGYESTCRIFVRVEDETPPTIDCPSQNLLTVYIDTRDEIQTLDLTSNMFILSDNFGVQNLLPISYTNSPPSSYSFADLYQTFPFTATVRDQNGNSASCQAQVFVTSRSCTPNSFPMPLHAQKSCTPTTFPQGYTCTITCDDRYHFEDDGGNGKTRTVSCQTNANSGAWNTPFISACVRDITYPRLTCPPSQEIDLIDEQDYRFVDFENTVLNYNVFDLNTIKTTVFSVPTYNFTVSDMYMAREVVLTVTDSADLQSSCRFQYVVKPRICSPLSYREPRYSSKSCSRNVQNTGYQCVLTADDGYLFRDHGVTATVNCLDNFAWDEVIPAAVPDTIAPTVSCPQSRTLYLDQEDDFIDVVFGGNYFSDYDRSDDSGTPAIAFQPDRYNFTRNNLYQTISVTFIATDKSNNAADCQFYVHLLPAICSPLALPDPVNGRKTCTSTFNGWSCELSCDAGYGFSHTSSATQTISCFTGSAWSGEVPGCSSLSNTAPTVYFGIYEYKYQPVTGQQNVDESCGTHYLRQQSRLVQYTLSNGTVLQMILHEAMADRMQEGCRLFANVPRGEVDITFIPELFTLDVLNIGTPSVPLNRQVVIYYTFTMTAMDANYLDICSSWLRLTLPNVPNGYEFAAAGIPGDNANCPELNWDNRMNQTSEGYQCLNNYFISPLDSNECRPCPAGSISNSVSCTPCEKGTYHASPSSMTCTSCGGGRTTRIVGATSASQCILPCPAGQVSEDGYSPCSTCPIGEYSIDTRNCVPCGFGNTTSTVGSSSPLSCIPIVTQKEPCGAGTEAIGDECVVCPEGEYRPLQASQCIPCSTGTTTFVVGAIESTECYDMCSGGNINSLTGKPPCTACPIGSYYRNNTYCESCPSGQTTRFTGSVSQLDCLSETSLRVNCPQGTFRNGTGCAPCERGTYAPSEEMNSCFSCPVGSWTYYEGATSRDMCFSFCYPGTTSPTGLSPCSPCGVGFYAFNATLCEQCPAGTSTKTDTASSSLECIPECSRGQFSVSGYNFDNTCKNCPANFYQDVTGRSFCEECLGSQYTSTGLTGLSSSADCLNTAPQDLCFAGRCSNGGTCVIQDHDFYCQCATGYYGRTCTQTVNFCENNPCFNGGNCQYTSAGYTCDCRGLATGVRCENVIETCSSDPDYCQNGGHCRNLPGRKECLCADGFSGATDPTCSIETPICIPNPCQNGGQCVDTSFGENLRRKCICASGYEGVNCEYEIDYCASSPCLYGGVCQPRLNGYRCDCTSGYTGQDCETRQNQCNGVNCQGGTCVDDYTLNEPRCICAPGYYYGSVNQYNIQLGTAASPLPTNPTTNGSPDDCRDRCSTDNNCASFSYNFNTGDCYIISIFVTVTPATAGSFNHYTKVSIPQATDNYWTQWYDMQTPANSNQMDDTESRADLNNNYGLNICEGTEPIGVECRDVNTKASADGVPGVSCTTNGLTCSGFAACNDYEVRYLCAVHRVFKNNQCSLRNYCSPNPCPIGSTCSNDYAALSYRCSCPSGLTGLNCQNNIDDCANTPCKNGGICNDRLNGYDCDCQTATGYTGRTCETRIAYCDGQNCNFRGRCELELTGYKCNCQPGYDGKDCENEIDKCVSSPCLHGGNCQKRFNDYFCDCPDGWTGKNCDVIVDNCASGGRFSCNAQCYSIFNDYYCKCPANTYGRDCEYSPDPCRDYNKCQNGAQCNYDLVNNMTCSCDMRYTGDGCEILVDHCSATTNNCQNGAMCITTQTGYRCVCAPGYNGSNCEKDIEECTGVECEGGTCIEDIGKHYCRCPLGKTGVNCEREKETDYDICFNHPEGLSYAKIPFPNLASNADSMSITLWVRFAQPGTEGTYFTMFIGDRLRDADTFMEFRHDGVRVYISTDSGFTPYTMLPFTYGYTLTDGSWHSMVLNYDLANGVMTLIADSITHTVIQNAALIIAERTFRFWVVIGCEFDQFSDSCVMGSRFHGCVSQVNFYKRELDFNTEPPILIRDPRHVFSPRIDVLLVWNEYELRGGERTIPSEADVASCVGRCKSYPVLSRPTISASNPCPGDMMVYSADRLTTVSWNEPVFENAASIIRPDFQSGASYHWGTYQITYIAVGANDEKAICSFKLYVQSSQCDTPPDPLGGFQTCEEDPYGYRGCSLACSSSSSRNYTIDRVVPNLFTCGPTGSWNVMKRFNRFRYPPCGEEYAQPARTRLYMKVVYQIATEACKAAEINFNGRVLDQFQLLNDEMNGGLCADTNCSDLQISIKCGPDNVNTISTLEVTIPDCVQRTIIDGENIPTQDFITCSVLGAADILNFADTIPNGYIMRSTYFITPTLICPAGRVLINDECVLCGAGTYYTMDSDGNPFCEDCPIGEYQNGEGEMSCESCGPNLTTEMMGSNDFSQCKAICPIGEYYTGDSTGCMPCPVGYFQDEVGQFFCKFCERGQTTSDPGATSRSQCQETCPSGQQLVNNGCVKCGIGFYRNETETRLCVSCPSGKITPAEGAVSRGDCYVEACEAGNRLNEQTNTCEPCPLGSYQDTKWQTFCIPCGSPYNWRTDSVGSADPTDCKFYCPSGEEAVDATSPGRYCRYCPIGTYKNNNFDIYGQCRPCSGNYRTETVGSVSEQNCTIYLCPAGERPNIDNTDCEMCPLGTYQPIQHSTDCISCNQGTSTRNEGATAETECEIYCASGQEKNSIGNCDVCDRGYYKDNALGLFSMCMPCPENYTTVERETEQEADCTIRACPAGTKRNALDTDCIECERGTYQQLPYQTMCDFCPSGTSTRQTKSTNRNQCEIFCQPGAEKNTVTGGCDTCSRGYYKDNSIDLFSVCTMCPIDRITASTGAVSISNCTIGNCTAGYRIDANDDCEICPKGFYQDQWWQRSCIQCGTDKTTEDPGATRADLCILKCPPGKQDVGGRCEECPRGYYKDQDIAAACTECPFGTTTEGTGATDQATCSLPACQVGEYLDRTGVVYDCKQCGYDTYQDEIWQETCKSCPAGLVTLMMGAQMITQCVRNCSSGSEYNVVTQGCDECAIGYYRNQFNRLETTCQLCDINFITATTGATSVNDCNIRNCTTPGEYRKDNQCEPCPIGTYLNEKWQTACTNCPEGYKTLNTGSISIADCRPTCPAGEFVGINNVCQKCPRGTYRDGLSGENCESCPDGLLTPGLGAVNDSECYISPCFKGKYYVRARQECVFCERGTYQDEDGKFQCKECPNPIKYTPAVGADDVSDCNSPCLRGRELDVAADTCDLCEVGYYQDADYQFSCIQCPPEKAFTSSRGSTSFTDCKNRCDAGNDCPSNALCVSTSTSFTCECFPNHVDFFGNGKDCRACSAGEYFITNANRCQACPARKYQPNEAQSECLTCPDDTEPNSDSTACVHKCDLLYCENGGTCNVGPPITCSCKKWYKGETCGDRYDAEDLADRPLDIAIPVSIGVGALILILIIIAVACFVCFRRTPKPHGQYSEFVDRTDKVSVHSYGQTPYNFASQKMMLAPGSEMVYDNQAYTGSTLAGGDDLNMTVEGNDPAVFVA